MPSSKGDSSELAWERGWTNRALHAPDRWSVQGIGPGGFLGRDRIGSGSYTDSPLMSPIRWTCWATWSAF